MKFYVAFLTLAVPVLGFTQSFYLTVHEAMIRTTLSAMAYAPTPENAQLLSNGPLKWMESDESSVFVGVNRRNRLYLSKKFNSVSAGSLGMLSPKLASPLSESKAKERCQRFFREIGYSDLDPEPGNVSDHAGGIKTLSFRRHIFGFGTEFVYNAMIDTNTGDITSFRAHPKINAQQPSLPALNSDRLDEIARACVSQLVGGDWVIEVRIETAWRQLARHGIDGANFPEGIHSFASQATLERLRDREALLIATRVVKRSSGSSEQYCCLIEATSGDVVVLMKVQ